MNTPIELKSEKSADRLKEIIDRLEQGVTDLFESDRYKEYLRVMARFHNYSFNNTLLIAMQSGVTSRRARRVSRSLRQRRIRKPSRRMARKQSFSCRILRWSRHTM